MAVSTTLGFEDLPALISVLTGDEKHDGSSFSTLEVLWVLYDRVLRVDPANPLDSERDRFLLSKGHGPAAYYAVLVAKGFLPVEALAGFGSLESPLGYHPGSRARSRCRDLERLPRPRPADRGRRRARARREEAAWTAGLLPDR
jgi:hypothetical protein